MTRVLFIVLGFISSENACLKKTVVPVKYMLVYVHLREVRFAINPLVGGENAVLNNICTANFFYAHESTSAGFGRLE